MRQFTIGDFNKQVGDVTDAAAREPVVEFAENHVPGSGCRLLRLIIELDHLPTPCSDPAAVAHQRTAAEQRRLDREPIEAGHVPCRVNSVE